MQKNTKKIQIELTSRQGDNWTWRKAGAKQPKGEIAESMLPSGSNLGDEIWVEIASNIDGIYVESVLPSPKTDQQGKNVQTLELLGAKKKSKSVNVNYRNNSSRRKKRKRQKPPEITPKEESKVAKRELGSKLSPEHTHRKKWLSSLAKEHSPVAEQLIKGGMPAVRSGVEADSKAGKGKELIKLAEQLLPDFRLAEWRDRADAAIENIDKVRLADLRAVLAAADGISRHSDIEATVKELRQKLQERLEKEHLEWLADINTLVEEDRIVRALNLSSHPPKAGMPLPEDLAAKLTSGVNSALTSDTPNKRWEIFLSALSKSPIAQRVEPAGLPKNPSPELNGLLEKAREYIPKISSQILDQKLPEKH